MNRRDLLMQLAAGAAGLGLSGRAFAEECLLEGPSVPAVTGPFAPSEFLATLGGRANPGERRAVGEHDMDLAAVTGVSAAPQGQVVRIHGRVVTAGCAPLAGAVVQLWQADAAGRYNHENERSTVSAEDLDPGFGYWGTTVADEEGRFEVRTVVPGAYPAGRNWWRPPHLHWRLTAPGLPEVIAQTYFEGDVLEGVKTIREYNREDRIMNLRDGFTEGFQGDALSRARQRVQDELLVRFTNWKDGVPTGELTLRVG